MGTSSEDQNNPNSDFNQSYYGDSDDLGKDTIESENESIAVIGIGCRFPGGIEEPESFWKIMVNGIDTIREVPPNRFDIDAYFDPAPDTPGKIVTRFGGFINSIDLFDAGFFGLSPWEAARLDPQQRLLLEVAWEALEDAGQPLEWMSDIRTGVFVGIYSNDYEIRMFDEAGAVDLYSATGGSHYSAAGRLSYMFNLKGPSMAVETACSSSLVATHLACQSLRSGESDLVLAGGVNLILNPHHSIAYSRGGMLSPAGRCRFGDAGADGFVRGEGCGILVLKSYRRAVSDGDHIYALILGSAVNNDGRDGHFLAPSPNGQIAVLKRAYQNAGVQPNKVHYIEAHGTGTVVGDPIEIDALAQIVGKNRPDANPCLTGSVKTNIGHAETASGVAGLIKAALSLKHRQVPPSLHFQSPHPEIAWDKINLKIAQETTPLAPSGTLGLAGVNSFGLTGMNAHIVLQENPPHAEEGQREHGEKSDPVAGYILPLSARSRRSLADAVKSTIKFIKASDDRYQMLQNICFSAGVRRTHHDYRLAVVGSSRSELLEKLERHSNIRKDAAGAIEKQSDGNQPDAVFVYSGQGPQWFAMGRQLLQHEPVFKHAIEKCATQFANHASWNLLEELRANESDSRLWQTEIAQPAIFALQIGLTELLRSWGIMPRAVVGHSVGEVAAACTAGVLTFEEAVRVVFHRGRIMQQATGRGKMAAIGLSEIEAIDLINPYEERLSIAAVNSPISVTISGDEDTLLEVMKKTEAKQIFQTILKVDYAFHSHHVADCAAQMISVLNNISPKAAGIPIVSTVTGVPASERDFGIDYWADNIRKTVRFAQAVGWLIDHNYKDFLEISPHPVLSLSIMQCLAAKNVPGNVYASLQHKVDERSSLLETAGKLYSNGYHIDWPALYSGSERYIRLPLYAWERSRHWINDDSYKARMAGEKRGLPANDTDSRSPSVSAVIPQNCYTIDWLPREQQRPLHSRHSRKSEKWLVFTDAGGVGERLADLITRSGHGCVTVMPGERFEALEATRYLINPAQKRDYELLAKELGKSATPDLNGIIHLWSLLPAPAEEPSRFAEQAAKNCGSVLLLIRAFSKQANLSSVRIWLVTKGAQWIEKGALDLAQSPLWGFGRVLALESTEQFGGLIDLDPEMDTGECAHVLWEELGNQDGEDQIALRGEQRFVARLIWKDSFETTGDPYFWRSDGAYLITGGLGRLGLKLARWMVEQGARHLVLVSRRPLQIEGGDRRYSADEGVHEKKNVVLAIEKMGTTVTVVQADVGDSGQMESLFKRFGNDLPPLTGIVHAAGAIAPKPLSELEVDDLNMAFQSKVSGTWNLHQFACPKNLDFLILFSSAASVLGSKDLAHYAAANHFLDAYAWYARMDRLPVINVNWGLWAGGWKDNQLTSHFTQAGLHPMPDDEGMMLIEQLLKVKPANTMYADIDWQVLAPIYEAKRSRTFLNEIKQHSNLKRDAKAATDISGFIEELQHLHRGDRLKRLRTFIRDQIASLLGFKESSQIDPAKGFFQMGMDSIRAVQLKARLESATGLTLPPTVAFDRPNVNSLADYVFDLAFGNESTAADDSELHASRMKPNVQLEHQAREALSEHELIDLLSKKLKGVG